MSVLQALRIDRVERLGALGARVQETGYADLQPLSVYLERGVVRRADQKDNHNVLGADMSKYQRVLPGDLVFNRLRTWQGGFGASRHEGIVSPAYVVVRPHRSDARYLDYVLHSAPYLAELTRLSKWMPPSQFDILWTDLRTVPIPAVSLDHQRRIAGFLADRVARIDQIVATRHQQIDLANLAFESRRREAVLGLGSDDRCRTELPWAVEVGTDRQVRQLRHLATIGTGHTPSRSNPEYWENCVVPWLTTTDVHRFRGDELDVLDTTAIDISELGLAKSAAVLHPAGTVALSRTASAGFSIRMGRDMATSQDFVTWTCGPDLHPDYLLATLRVMRPFLLGQLATGSTHKTIYFPDLQDLRLPVPPMNAQLEAVNAIAYASETRTAGLNALRREVDLLKEYRSSLITAAVTGELDVTTAGSGIPG